MAVVPICRMYVVWSAVCRHHPLDHPYLNLLKPPRSGCRLQGNNNGTTLCDGGCNSESALVYGKCDGSARASEGVPYEDPPPPPCHHLIYEKKTSKRVVRLNTHVIDPSPCLGELAQHTPMYEIGCSTLCKASFWETK